MEPISHYLFLVKNQEGEVTFTYKSGPMCTTGFNKDIKLDDGSSCNAQLVSVERATVPEFPLIVEMKPQPDKAVQLIRVMHARKMNQYVSIPLIFGKKIA